MNPTINDRSIVVHDPFLDRLGGMIQRANARLGLDAKGNPQTDPINPSTIGECAGPQLAGGLNTPSFVEAPRPLGQTAERGSFSYSGALVAQDFSGISIPADAKHANPRRVKVIATLCPDCGEPMTHEDRQTSEDADGRCFQIACAGWGCDCGYFKADE